MDISKLPKLSQTPAPAENEVAPTTSNATNAPAVPTGDAQTIWCMRCHAPNPPGMAFCGSCGASLGGSSRHASSGGAGGGGVEAWLSIGLGAILLLMFPRLLKYVSHLCFGSFFAPYVTPDGTELPYTTQLDFWSDLGVTLFALVLLLDGAVLVLTRKRWLIAAALALTAGTTLYNLGYLLMTFNRAGLAIVSAFAVLFGGYIAAHQWRLLQTKR